MPARDRAERIAREPSDDRVALPGGRFIEIHTSDREWFKRCRRRWNWASRLRENLVAEGADSGAPWLGSGFHFAMEDYFGHNRFKDPRLAFEAYRVAHKQGELPGNVGELTDLARGMIAYFVGDWLPAHPEDWETLWIGDEPQVEVEVQIDITGLVHTEWADQVRRYRWPKDIEIVYVTTFDRVVVTRRGTILGLDYKTAKEFDRLNLLTNPQAEAYDWALDIFYEDFVVDGIIWQQHYKGVPSAPTLIKKGTAYSQDRRQQTTHSLYRRALLETFGTVPEEYVDFLNFLAEQQTEEGDRYVRRDIIRKNDHQRAAVERKIAQEVVDMLDPDLPLYPNPTRDCSWDCPFKGPCLALDDGSDAAFMLASEYVQWEGYKDDWRGRIRWPEGD